MESLIRQLIPHDPSMGLYVAPDIPSDKLQHAIDDYAGGAVRGDVVALYDATLMGSARDGALFLADRLVFQNNNLEPAHEVRYEDLIEVELKKKLLGGSRLALTVNRGQATISLEMDFSGKPKAAPFVARFLEKALFRSMEMDEAVDVTPEEQQGSGKTDVRAVEEALIDLLRNGRLSEADYREMMRYLNQ